jgi:hypothetical protein
MIEIVEAEAEAGLEIENVWRGDKAEGPRADHWSDAD